MEAVRHGKQPLDELMMKLEISNNDLVEVSEEQLTHKNVANGRKGRELTMNIQMKILNALNAAQHKRFALADLFTYKGRSQAAKPQTGASPADAD